MASNDVQIQIIGKDLASGAFRSVNSAAASTTAQIASLGRATGGLNQVFTSAAGFAAGIAGFNGLTAAIQSTVGAVFSFKKGMEVHETGMAGILLSMTEINGRALTWGESIALSKDIMTQLNSEALRTAATTEELTGAFRGILGPALNAKMTIGEIVQLSSAGVNAVKSIMPNNTDVQRQIVQELRDLVAGGIQPSSSTLATALGLKDKDIAAAKESSEGLFKFLMDRLKGFETSAPAYARTWQGIQDQIKEGFTLAGSQGTDQLFAVMKDEMAAVAAQVVVFNKETGKMEVNPEIVSTFRSISDTVIVAGGEIKALASDISVVAVPAAKLLGGAIKLAAEHAEAFTLATAGWVAIRKINVIMSDVSAVTAGATEAQTLLGKAVLDTQKKMAEQAAVAAEAAAAERSAAIAAAQAQMRATVLAGTTAETAAVAAALGQKNLSVAIEQTVVAKNEESAAAIRTAEVINAANAAAKMGQFEVAQAILATNLSMSEQAAVAAAMAERLVLASTAGKLGQYGLAESILATNITLGEQGIAAAVAGEKTVVAAGSGAIAQRELAGSVALTTAAHIESGIAASTAGATTVTAMGVAGTAVGGMLSTVWALIGGWFGVAAAIGYSIYKLQEWHDEQNKGAEVTGYDEWGRPIYGAKPAPANASMGGFRSNEGRKSDSELAAIRAEELKKQLTAKYPGSGDDGKGAAKAAKAAERAYEEQQKLQDKIADMIAKMNGKISDETSTVFESSTAKLTAETDNMKRELDKSKIDFGKYGIDVSGVYVKITQYQDTMTAKVEKQRSRSLAALITDTKKTYAQISGDTAAIADAEYEDRMRELEVEREKKLKEVAVSSDSFKNQISALNNMAGIIEAGNIDLNKRPLAQNKDGSISTVRSISVNIEGMETLIPTVSQLGKLLTDEEALAEYYTTGKHLGKFSSTEDADAYAVQLHNQQDLYVKDIQARKAIDDSYVFQEAAALKKRNDAYRDAQLQKYDIAVQHNSLLTALENQTATAIDSMNKRVLDSKISYMQTELQKAQLTQQDRIKLEKELADTIEQRNDIMSKNMSDAVGIAINDIKNEQFDWVKSYKSTWSSIDSSTNNHLKSMLKGNEDLAKGIKGTITDIGSAFVDMISDMVYQTYILQPLRNWFTSMLKGFGGSSSESSDYSFAGISVLKAITGFAGGGLASGWSIVGEKGPELVNFSNPSRVYTADQTRQALSGSSSQSNGYNGPPIIMHVHANDVQSFRKSKGQVLGEFGSALQQARRNM